jgi:LemA protein
MVLAAALAGGWAKYTSTRNRLMEQREAVAAQWAQVDAALQERADLVSRLAGILKKFTAQPSGVFERAAEACAALKRAATPQEKIRANQRLDAELARLLVISENYPKLRSSRSFLQSQDEVAEAENRIAVERRKYNEALQRYNTSIVLFPNNVAAWLAGLSRDDAYFQTDASGAAGGARTGTLTKSHF